MALNTAEQIMQSVVTTVTGLTTTGANVSRGLVYPIQSRPWLQVIQGGSEILGDDPPDNMGFIDADLTITIRATVEESNDYETKLNLIWAEVYNALLADYTQGLAFVHKTIPGGTAQPEGEAGEKIIGQLDIDFIIRYRHSLLDITTL